MFALASFVSVVTMVTPVVAPVNQLSSGVPLNHTSLSAVTIILGFGINLSWLHNLYQFISRKNGFWTILFPCRLCKFG